MDKDTAEKEKKPFERPILTDYGNMADITRNGWAWGHRKTHHDYRYDLDHLDPDLGAS